MGIGPHFDLWNYFSVSVVHRTRTLNWRFRGGGGCVVIHIMSGQGVNSYFDIHMPKSINGWQKQWFYLRNDADALLPVFTGNRPTPHHNWRYGVAKNDLDKL
jgi:hypothetical protein